MGAREGITADVVTQVEIFKEMGQWECKENDGWETLRIRGERERKVRDEHTNLLSEHFNFCKR